MEEYSAINAILLKKGSTFQQFQALLKQLKIQKETYLNLFLTTLVIHKPNSPSFTKYVHLLVHFKDFTGKKSANINYIGYKDKISILMHACAKGIRQNIEYLMTYPALSLEKTDPKGKNAAFYAIMNHNEETSIDIINLLLSRQPLLLQSKGQNDWTLLNQALQQHKMSVIQLLLKKGINVNCQLADTKNTILHQLYNKSDFSKEEINKLILLFIKYKINMKLVNKEGRSNLDIFKQYKKNMQESINFNPILDGQESNIQSFDSQFDKASMTTFNIQTKIEEISSERCQIESNICSLQIDFSYTDFQSEQNNLNQDFQNFQIDDNCEDENKNVDFEVFSKEIFDFSTIYEEKHQKASIIIQPFILYLQEIASSFNLKLQFVGSFATGLWTNYSDIDINLVCFQNEFINFQSILQKIFRIMTNRKRELSIVDINFHRNKISSIKIGLNEFFNNYQIDISIFHRFNQNRKYVSFIVQSIYNLPFIKPLFFIFRKFCEMFKLHDYMLGGLKSYTLFLMIYNVLKQAQMKNVGQAFNYISFYYGVYFQYSYELITSNEDSSCRQAQMRLNIFDPLNVKNNMGGKNTKANGLQNMFRVIYFSLNQQFNPPYLEHLLTLNQYF